MKRMLSLLLALLLILGMLAGCQPQKEEPTPDHQENSKPSVDEPDPVVPIVPGNVVIHEVMPDNERLCMGHENDWVELRNLDEEEVSLDGYYLTDDPDKLHAMPLDGFMIPAEGYLVITLDDSSAFKLASTGESVYLVCEDTIISQLTFPETTKGEAVDENGLCQYPTPGFANTEEGYLEYLQTLVLPELIINEVMSSNNKYMPYKGECYDLVELKNNSDHELNLSGYYLSDKRSEPQRYALPDITLQPGEFMIIYCSGVVSLGNDHTSFKLSADGETLYLSKDGSFVDILAIPAQLQKNESYGRDGNIPVYFTEPTFGKENTTGFFTGIDAPTASVESGVYEEAVTVTLSGEGNIYYTLSGLNPTTSSARYEEPITITGITTLRCFSVSNGRSSPIASYTYTVGVEHDLPILVVAIPQGSLSGSSGVLNHPGTTYEHQATVTLIENGQEMFSVPCGFRLHGNGSRYCRKQNFQLRFRSEYGAGRLEYKLFDDIELSSFNSLLLKGGSEDYYIAVMRDEVSTMLARGTSLYTQAMKPVALYLGDQYWGVYYIRERFSDDYVADHLNVSEESVDLNYCTQGYVQSGSNKDYKALKQYCKSHDMSTEENYQYLASQIDVQSLMDWYIFRSFLGDTDLANIRRFRSTEADGLWRWMFFDMDWGFYHSNNNYFSDIVSDYNGEPILMRALIASETGRDLFLKRCAEMLKERLNEEYISATVDSIAYAVDEEMVKDRERWGYSYEKWEKYVQQLRDFDADGKRTKGFLKDLKAYFYLTDEEMTYYFGDILDQY